LDASKILLNLLVNTFALFGPIVFGLDDTIERRRGENIKAWIQVVSATLELCFADIATNLCPRRLKNQPIGTYPLAKGQVFQRHQVGFTQQAAVCLNLVGWWSSRYDEHLYLVTSLTNGYLACKYYRRRFQIETFFSDQKSRGFHLHKSHLSNPLRLSHLLLAACLAYLRMVCQGLLTITENKVGLIDRPDRIDKSLFRLGLDWIHYALKSNLDFTPIFPFHLLFPVPNVR
jgi:Transposase DDE domain